MKCKIGRDGVIRTLDPHNPIVVRYQAALRPDTSGAEYMKLFRMKSIIFKIISS
ncbi:MAG: Unknown protein [uncultured Thiotrichaceae bacterium]|uniref:Uncharacterized protein n=1 Tax=uncultured Thiotrichaceae bacterium TaxID=298394 RepID=A0A6S6SZZ7_9GAMM|nr:MAG: Unknown protein [uncultured Thiotrichaceae bacterium]